jgi:hypothetical protein
MLVGVNRFEGTCHLDWWANSSTNLGGDEVSVTVSTDTAGWSAHGRLLDADDQALEGFAFLCDLDPVFTLRFPDNGTISVTVHPAPEPGHFTLTEHIGPTSRPITHDPDPGPHP